MKCSCPKCNAHVELDSLEVSEGGSPGKCPDCKAKFTVRLEPFAGRGLWKGEQITCSRCGSLLGHATHCPDCNLLYPDYYVTQPPKVRETRSILESLNVFRGLSLKKGYRPEASAYSLPKEASKGSGKSARLLFTILILVLLAGGGAGGYYYYKIGSEYLENYVRAVYRVKTGEDAAQKICTKLAADWKAKADSGVATIPKITVQDENELNKISEAIAAAVHMVDKPPKKYQKALESLVKLNGVFQKSATHARTPSGNWTGYAENTAKIDAEFKAAALELKGILPPDLADALKTGQAKYRPLQNF